jgi:hypothetical protein
VRFPVLERRVAQTNRSRKSARPASRAPRIRRGRLLRRGFVHDLELPGVGFLVARLALSDLLQTLGAAQIFHHHRVGKAGLKQRKISSAPRLDGSRSTSRIGVRAPTSHESSLRAGGIRERDGCLGSLRRGSVARGPVPQAFTRYLGDKVSFSRWSKRYG